MTHAYDWFGLPSSLVLRCPACHAPVDFKWSSPTRRPGSELLGRLACPSCGKIDETFRAHWPENAFFRTTVRGHELWAWSVDHAEAIRSFVASTTRRPGDHPGFKAALLHLPKVFTLAANRDATVAAIDRMLSQQRCVDD